MKHKFKLVTINVICKLKITGTGKDIKCIRLRLKYKNIYSVHFTSLYIIRLMKTLYISDHERYSSN